MNHSNNRLLKFFVFSISSFLITMGVSPAYSSSHLPARSNSVDICPGVDESKVDQVDILILLDNSKSLSSTKENSPTDKDGRRFDALESMFRSISIGIKGVDGGNPRVKVDVSLMAFAQTTKFPFSDQGTGIVKLDKKFTDPVGLSQEIRAILSDETQQGGTNFINALTDARNFLDVKPNTNCKFLIWFTDGVFDYYDTLKDGKKESDYLKNLVENTCSPKGWAQQLRESHVNTYVVLLGDPVALRKQGNFQESLDLMAQITGDRSTSELGEVNICSGEDPSVVGEIFLVGTKEIGKLTPVFQRIGALITGAEDLLCPTPDINIVSTPGLPNSKFFKSFSLISLDLKKLPKIDDIKLVTNTGKKLPISVAFNSPAPSSEEVTQMDFPSSGAAPFEKGWKIELSANLAGFCLMATFIESLEVKITKVGNNPTQVENAQNILTPEEISQLVFLQRDQQNLNEEIVSPGEIWNQIDKVNAEFLNMLRAELDIEADPLSPVFGVGKKLSFEVSVGKPIPELQKCLFPWVFRSDRAPTTGDTPPNKNFATPACEINTLGQPAKNAVVIDINSLTSALQSTVGCEVIEPSLIINGENKGQVFTLPVDEKATVAINLKIGEKKTNCNFSEIDGVGFTYGSPSQTATAKVTAVFDFKEPPCTFCVKIVTAVSVLVALLLSLLLLRFISSVLAIMPERNGMYSYETLVEIGLSAFGQVRLSIDGVDVNSFQPSAVDLKLPLKSSSKSALVLQNIRLDRRLSGWFKPFSDAKAEVGKDIPAAYWQQTGSGGLAIPFRKAIIVSKPENSVMSSDALFAQLTILVPISGAESGIPGVTNLLRGQKLKEVCREFRDKTGSTSSAPATGSELSKVKGTVSPQSGSGTQVAPPAPPSGPKKRPGPPPIPHK